MLSQEKQDTKHLLNRGELVAPLPVFPVFPVVVLPAPAKLLSVTCAEVDECSPLPVSGASGT
jgi:hypothetical protein